MLSMIGHRHFFTRCETDLQIHCLTYRSIVDAPQAASSCARICSKLRSSQRSRSRSHAVGNDRYAHWRRRRRRLRSSAFPPARRMDDVRRKAACGRRTRREGVGLRDWIDCLPDGWGSCPAHCWTACSRMPTREERGGIFAEILAGNSGGPFRPYRTMIRNFWRPLFGRRRHSMPVSPDYRVGLCAARLAKRVKLSYLENPGSPGDRRPPGVMKNCLLPPLGPLFAKCRG